MSVKGETTMNAVKTCSAKVKEHNIGRFTQTRECKGKVVVSGGGHHYCQRHRSIHDQWVASCQRKVNGEPFRADIRVEGGQR
jgi:hypothetical protein